MKDDFDNWLAEREKDDTPADDRELPCGLCIGDYRIVALLGRGGFADVYRADGANGESVAIKILHKLDDKSRARFVRESEILSQIKHRNIPRLLSFGSYGDRPYMVTELLKGCELPDSDRKIVKFLEQIMSAVEELHRHGFVHRDIKPDNILARDDGTPVLIDFGLASPVSVAKRETEALSIEDGKPVAVGTPGYSAPEQFTSCEATAASDIHAIGMLINACFKGKPPSNWSRLIERATCSIGSRRYQSVKDMKVAIRDSSNVRPKMALVAEILSMPILGVSVVSYLCFLIGTLLGKTHTPLTDKTFINLIAYGCVVVFLASVEFGLRNRKNWARCCRIVLGLFCLSAIFVVWFVNMWFLNISGGFRDWVSAVAHFVLVLSYGVPSILLLMPSVRRWFKTA
ncbi:MAG: serine/threonine protein kinase [Victivallales bacterium]|nr:serine/threonine protein kinase [Victivallales bacterium]